MFFVEQRGKKKRVHITPHQTQPINIFWLPMHKKEKKEVVTRNDLLSKWYFLSVCLSVQNGMVYADVYCCSKNEKLSIFNVHNTIFSTYFSTKSYILIYFLICLIFKFARCLILSKILFTMLLLYTLWKKPKNVLSSLKLWQLNIVFFVAKMWHIRYAQK